MSGRLVGAIQRSLRRLAGSRRRSPRPHTGNRRLLHERLEDRTLLSGGSGLSGDIGMRSVVADGQRNLTVRYEIADGPVIPFEIAFYRSENACVDSGD